MLASNALYQGIYTAINAATGSVPVFDHTPQGDAVSYPFIVMEEHQAEDSDTDTSNGSNVVQYVEVWSQYMGLQEVQTIMDQIYTALHKQESAITLPGGYKVVIARCKSDEILGSEDGLTRMGRMAFEFLVDDGG